MQRTLSWLINTSKRHGPKLHIFYTLGGDLTEDEVELAASGYRNSRPVYSGNRAVSQLQLGTYGDVFETVFRYCVAGHVLDRATAQMLVELADQCCDEWHKEDSGIWELTRQEHYTVSKMGC